MVFHSSLRNSHSPQVSKTTFSILVDLSNAVAWMASTCPLISKSSCLFTKPLEIVPSESIKIIITVTFIFHSFFLVSWQHLGTNLSFYFGFYCVICRDCKVYYSADYLLSLLLLKTSWCSRLAEIRCFVSISKSQRCLCIKFSRTDFGLCIYLLFIWSNLNFLHNFQWIIFPTQSCLVLYSLSANFLTLAILSILSIFPLA